MNKYQKSRRTVTSYTTAFTTMRMESSSVFLAIHLLLACISIGMDAGKAVFICCRINIFFLVQAVLACRFSLGNIHGRLLKIANRKKATRAQAFFYNMMLWKNKKNYIQPTIRCFAGKADRHQRARVSNV